MNLEEKKSRLQAVRRGLSSSLGRRRIGQIVERLPELDIGLVSLDDPSISFSNGRYFQAACPRRMIPHAQIRAGNTFQIDGISTGRLDLVSVAKTFYFLDPIPPAPSAVEHNLANDAQS